MSPDPYAVLAPGQPLFPAEQPAHICAFLGAVADGELYHWPRRNVACLELVRQRAPCPCGCSAHVVAILVMN